MLALYSVMACKTNPQATGTVNAAEADLNYGLWLWSLVYGNDTVVGVLTVF